MKLRDSGMPDEVYWESLFEIPAILDAMQITSGLVNVAEMGCGFGTFTIPVAQRISGTLFAFDIDPEMVNRTAERATAAGLSNVDCLQRDIMEQGFNLPASSVDAVLFFNILHCESPEILLGQAAHVVRDGGVILVIHWRHDNRTPRGPDLAIRPLPEQVVAWARTNPALQAIGRPIDLPPWHYGLSLEKRTNHTESNAANRSE